MSGREAITLEEWLEEGEALFGKCKKKWAFRCPACGHVNTVQDFLDIKADPNCAYAECIGRKNGKGEDFMKGIDKGNGCNWAAYGLFGTLSKGRMILLPDKSLGDINRKVNVFDFADKESD